LSQELRTPEAIYVGYTMIKFRKEKGIIHYYISSYKSKSEIPDEVPEGVVSGIYKGEEQLIQFNKCKTLEQVLAIHHLGDVM